MNPDNPNTCRETSGEQQSTRHLPDNPTTGEWTLVPRALHFNIMRGDTLVYEGVTSEKQGNALVGAINAELAAERKQWRKAAEVELELHQKQLAAAQATMVEAQQGEWTEERLLQYADPDRSDLNQLASAINASIDAAVESNQELRWLRAIHGGTLTENIAAAQQPLVDALELAWGVIANAGGGDWDKEGNEWREAAIRWRDNYFGILPQVSQASSEQPNANEPPVLAKVKEGK